MIEKVDHRRIEYLVHKFAVVGRAQGKPRDNERDNCVRVACMEMPEHLRRTLPGSYDDETIWLESIRISRSERLKKFT